MKKVQISKTAIALASAGFLTSPLAGEDVFSNLDANADGYISAEEAATHQGLTMGYMKADSNKDGQIDAAEFSTFEVSSESMQPIEDK